MVLLTILKYIGIAVLVLLALVLAAVLLVLFVPVRYSLSGSFHGEKPAGEAKASWLCSLVKVRLLYDGSKTDGFISVFGIRVKTLIGDKKKDGKQQAPDETDILDTGAVQTSEGAGGGTVAQKAENIYTTYMANIDADEAQIDPAYARYDTGKGQPATDNARLDTGQAVSGTGEEQISPSESSHESELEPSSESSHGVSGVFSRFSSRIRKLWESAERKVESAAAGLKQTAKAIYIAIKDKTDKAKALYALYKNPKYADSLHVLKSEALKLLYELRPRKGGGRLRFGADDPYTTGMAMEAAAFFYPVYSGWLEVIPDFGESVIDADLDIKGRIRIFTAGVSVLKVFFNKGLRHMYRKARLILELD